METLIEFAGRLTGWASCIITAPFRLSLRLSPGWHPDTTALFAHYRMRRKHAGN